MELAVNGDGGGVSRSMQAVGLQVLVAKEPRGANRTPGVCGRYVSTYGKGVARLAQKVSLRTERCFCLEEDVE